MTRIAATVLSLAIASSVLAGARPVRPVNPPDPVVNVNTATVQQLAFLPGVGPKVAEAIVAARPFVSVDALLTVKRIGPKRLEALRPFVRVTGETTAVAKIRARKVVRP